MTIRDAFEKYFTGILGVLVAITGLVVLGLGLGQVGVFAALSPTILAIISTSIVVFGLIILGISMYASSKAAEALAPAKAADLAAAEAQTALSAEDLAAQAAEDLAAQAALSAEALSAEAQATLSAEDLAAQAAVEQRIAALRNQLTTVAKSPASRSIATHVMNLIEHCIRKELDTVDLEAQVGPIVNAITTPSTVRDTLFTPLIDAAQQLNRELNPEFSELIQAVKDLTILTYPFVLTRDPGYRTQIGQYIKDSLLADSNASSEGIAAVATEAGVTAGAAQLAEEDVHFGKIVEQGNGSSSFQVIFDNQEHMQAFQRTLKRLDISTTNTTQGTKHIVIISSEQVQKCLSCLFWQNTDPQAMANTAVRNIYENEGLNYDQQRLLGAKDQAQQEHYAQYLRAYAALAFSALPTVASEEGGSAPTLTLEVVKTLYTQAEKCPEDPAAYVAFLLNAQQHLPTSSEIKQKLKAVLIPSAGELQHYGVSRALSAHFAQFWSPFDEPDIRGELSQDGFRFYVPSSAEASESDVQKLATLLRPHSLNASMHQTEGDNNLAESHSHYVVVPHAHVPALMKLAAWHPSEVQRSLEDMYANKFAHREKGLGMRPYHQACLQTLAAHSPGKAIASPSGSTPTVLAVQLKNGNYVFKSSEYKIQSTESTVNTFHIVIDDSGSMATAVGNDNRFTAARMATISAIEQLPHDKKFKIQLINSGAAFLTGTKVSIPNWKEKIQNMPFKSGGTPLGKSIIQVLREIDVEKQWKRPEELAQHALLICTDGEDGSYPTGRTLLNAIQTNACGTPALPQLISNLPTMYWLPIGDHWGADLIEPFADTTGASVKHVRDTDPLNMLAQDACATITAMQAGIDRDVTVGLQQGTKTVIDSRPIVTSSLGAPRPMAFLETNNLAMPILQATWRNGSEPEVHTCSPQLVEDLKLKMDILNDFYKQQATNLFSTFAEKYAILNPPSALVTGGRRGGYSAAPTAVPTADALALAQRQSQTETLKQGIVTELEGIMAQVKDNFPDNTPPASLFGSLKNTKKTELLDFLEAQKSEVEGYTGTRSVATATARMGRSGVR